MKKILKSKIFIIILQIIAWIVIGYFFISTSNLRILLTVKQEFLTFSFIVIACYLNYFVIYPFVFKSKFRILYFPLLFIMTAIMTIIEMQFVKYKVWQVFENNQDYINEYIRYTYLYVFLRNASFIAFSVVYKFYIDAKNVAKKEIINLKNEIKYQKNKVDNHFLLNTMNIIYASSLDNSPNMTDQILTLSELIRFGVEISDKDIVTLDEEIKFIENYMSLEKLRHRNAIDLSITIDGDKDKVCIMPMTFQCFVNNAFKYVREDGKGYIKIKIDVTDTDKIIFICENNKRITPCYSCISTKQGIKNTMENLNLFYHEKQEIKIIDENGIYKVILTLPNKKLTKPFI